jgi:O-antigen/teichoic acid export membrane protein
MGQGGKSVTVAAGISGSGGEMLAQAQRSALGVFAVRVAGAGLAYATQVLLARLMGKAEYGVFATVWIWVTVLGHGSLWGLSQTVCRFVPHYRVGGELDLLRGFLAGGAAFTLVSSAGIAVAGGTLLWFGQTVIGEAYLLPFALALLILPLFALQDYVEGVARSFNWTALAIAPVYLLRQGLICAGMIGAVVVGLPADPWVALACTLVATAIALGVQTLMLLARLQRTLPRGGRLYRFKDWMTASLPIAFVDLTALGLTFADVLILGLFLPPAEVGVYFAATRILQFVLFVQYAASAATAQRFAEAKARGDATMVGALVGRTARVMSFATLGIGAGLLAVAPLLLSFFGPGFEAGFGALAILVAGLAVQSAFGPAEDVLTMLGAERLCAVISLIALGVAVALNLVLIPAFGIAGAAAAMALSTIGRGAALAAAARLRLGVATHVLA